MTDAPELKPCPFCGGDKLEEDALERVLCTGCGATAPYGYKTKETWNTRAGIAQSRIIKLTEFASELLDMMDWWGTGSRESAEQDEKKYRNKFAELKEGQE